MSRINVAYRMVAPGKPLERAEYEVAAPGAGEVVVQVAGCGLCHTDMSFLSGQVRTNRPLPLVLGHEVSGTVVEVSPEFESLAGKDVVVPAVLPCGECFLCAAGRGNACRAQKMPGNDMDGGFARFMTVPGRCVIPLTTAVGGHALWQLAVVADALTTPYQSVTRANVRPGDVAVFVGLGGVGGFGVQVAAAFGATVFGIDVDAARIGQLGAHGLARGFDAREMDARRIRTEISAECDKRGLQKLGWKIFETSGTAAGQETAFGLLTHTGTLGIVGYTTEKISLRLSNLMAFDATAFGNWGCDPALYPAAIDLVRSGKVTLDPFVQRFGLDEINEVLEKAGRHELTARPVLVP